MSDGGVTENCRRSSTTSVRPMVRQGRYLVPEAPALR